MDAADFDACLDKLIDSPEVAQMLATLGVKKKLRASGDDDDMSVELPKLGLLLGFYPEGPKSSRLKFNEVHFYTNAEAGYKTFPGVLPRGLTFQDDQATVRKKLGKPAKWMKEYLQEKYIFGNRRIRVKYAKSIKEISMITFSVYKETD